MRIEINQFVQLTEIRPTDKEAFVQWLNDKDIYDNTLLIPNPYGAADADFFLSIVSQCTVLYGQPAHFAIRDLSEHLIGVCGFDQLVLGQHAALGYWLAKPYWGQGIMTAVVRAICPFARERWQLTRIEAEVFRENLASARVLEKSGFELQGIRHKQHQKDERWIDTRHYAWVAPQDANAVALID